MVDREEDRESLPSVAAYFADPDEHAVPFLAALGQVVVAAAGLESNLRLELTRLLLAAQASQESTGGKAFGDQVAELENLTAGQLLSRLREQGLPKDLEQRIADAISRRNRLVHHLFEDPLLVKAITRTETTNVALGQLQQLALDCAALSVELQQFALPKFEALTGTSKEELLNSVLALNPTQIQQQPGREQLEAIQALAGAADWADTPRDLNEGHSIQVEWRGKQVETLADLLRPGLRAVCIGINPSPTSVDAGHYYQGPLGRRFWQRLHQAGVIEEAGNGREDDTAFIAGIGFTDVVKRPTPRANEISASEFLHGRELLAEKLRSYRPGLLIFTFKKAATSLVGPFQGHGYRRELDFAGIPIFVMPGPYERADRVTAALGQLRELLAPSSRESN